MESQAIIELVNSAPPSNAPRQIHAHISSVLKSTGGKTTSRTIWQDPTVRNFTGTFSRAAFSSVEICFVPTAAATSHTIAITCAFTPDDDVPSDLTTLWAAPGCRHFVTGGRYSVPSVITTSAAFSELFLSELIKPAPLEKRRLAFSFCIEIRDASGTAVRATDDPLVNVFLRARVLTGGQS